MSHPILAMPPCAAQCSGRIDLIPSRLAATLWFVWLALASGVVLFAVALPWAARLAIGVLVVAPGILAVRRAVLLAGPKGVRAIEWTAEGAFVACLGPGHAREPATLDKRSFRLGVRYWVLYFVTPVGRCAVLVVATPRNNRAFRQLSRCLNLRLRRASGQRTRPAVTIPPKV